MDGGVGFRGPKGEIGEAGSFGDDGIPGESGPAGIPGAKGLKGSCSHCVDKTEVKQETTTVPPIRVYGVRTFQKDYKLRRYGNSRRGSWSIRPVL